MQIGAVSKFCPQKLNLLNVSKPNAVSFGSGQDSFESSMIISANFSSDVNSANQEQILNAVEEIAKGDSEAAYPVIGAGTNGIVYKIDGLTGGFDSPLAVKISYEGSISLGKGELQRTNSHFEGEKEILQKAKVDETKNQKYVASALLKDGRSVLVTSFVNGTSPDPKTNPLDKEKLEEILRVFEELDENGVLHRDLKKEKVAIDEEGNVGLLDFGEAVEFDIKDPGTNSEEHNFPEFIPPSNIRNFEDTLLFPYLNELKKTDPKKADELFMEYLPVKGEFYERRADSIRRIIDSSDLDKETKASLEEMENYQRVTATMLKNPDEAVVTAEKLAGEITYNSELAYKNEILLLNPLANITLKMNSLIAAKRLEAFCQNRLTRPNSFNRRQYFEYQEEYAKYRLNKVSSWLTGLVSWLTACLTTDTKTAPGYKKDVIDQCVRIKGLNDFEIPDITEINLKDK